MTKAEDKVEKAKAEAREARHTRAPHDSHLNPRQKAEAERVAALREEKRDAGKIDTLPLDTRTVNAVANYGDPDVDPRVGEQNVPADERIDGYTDGVRHDQMEGVQAAAQSDMLDQDQLIEENLENPPNRDALENQQFVERRDRAEHVSRKTEEEMSRGADALGHSGRPQADGARTEAQARRVEATQKAASTKTPANRPL